MSKLILIIYLLSIAAAVAIGIEAANYTPPGPMGNWERLDIHLDNQIAQREIINAWDLNHKEAD